MSLSPGIVATVLAVVVLVELPDKTMVAALVLSSRYRPLPVLAGVGIAIVLQMGIAVTVGGLLSLLPRPALLAVVAALFAVGSVLLLRESLGRDDDEEDPEETPVTTSAWRIAALSFGVLFAAELGDGSQLATAALSARYAEPLSVFVGAWLGEMAVCTLAVLLGRAVLRVVPLRAVQRAAAALFAVFAGLALVELVRAL